MGGGVAPLNRRGIVIIAVLVVIAVLSLAGYHYTDMMTSEYRVAMSFTRAAQVRATAESGVNYAMVLLGNPDNLANVLNGVPFSNPAIFQGQTVPNNKNGTGPQPLFSIVVANDPNDPASDGSLFRYGVADEGGKINPNTLMKLDPTGTTLYNMLMKLPSMTDDIANSIVFWVDPKATPRSSGADATYYAGLTPTYAPKNGPLDSIEELLLVKGVTPLLLYGYDKNRNGVIDPDETQTGGDPNNVGWAPYLTIYSRELNVDSTGNKRIYVNDTNLQTLQTSLAAVDADLATFIILCRLHAPTAIPATGLPKNISLSPANSVNTGDLNLGTAKAANTIASLYDLIDVYVTIPPPDPKAKDAKSTYVASPLMTTSIRSTRSYSSGAGGSQLADLLPKLLDKMTVKKDQQLYGRINLNTASQTVLTALANAGTITQTTGTGTNQKVTSTSLLSEADVTTILNTRPPLISTTPPEEVYQSPAWLITQAKLKVSTVKALEKYITTRSQVYRFQVIGYLDGGGPITRLDVAIDTNNGNPRVVHYRDLSELGKGFDIPQNNGQ